ncbi:MAG: NAD-dependent epimerase/dehydratase family protein, partial [Rhodospirillales bacterium]|nr:NAD-dependent epimerase/dehydratase family protein [Rhodospirillales bacterium]
MKILLTGGCGFIGSAVVRRAVRQEGHQIVNVDKMTYAASENALEDALTHANHILLKRDICDL